MGRYSRTAHADSKQTSQLADNLLNRIREMSPTVDWVLEKYGLRSIHEYVERIQPERPDPYQSSQVLYQAVYDQVKPKLGEKIAQCTISDMAAHPFVMTANHHGVDFFAQSVQGTLIFGSQRKKNGVSLSTIPVFACGNIPLNNLTYPRGFLVYSLQKGSAFKIPSKIPIFPDRLKRKMVSRVESYDYPMVERAIQRIHKMAQKGDLSTNISETLLELLTEEYASADILNLDNYSDQAVVLNNRLWRRLFTYSEVPNLVYLEIEKIVSKVLATDLKNAMSLFHILLFDPQVLQKLLQCLDGVRVCWRRDNLTRRMLDGDPRKINANTCGTSFFWGVDEQGMRVPLLCIPEGKGHKKLVGLDDKGNQYDFALSPEVLVDALENGQILPSLFTCYTVLSLARGLVCAGGYYQSEYLPQVQQGVATALGDRNDYRAIVQKIRQVPTRTYLSGMQTVMCQSLDHLTVPAGPIEIIAGGGLTPSDMERIKQLSVREAHVASLFETIGDLSTDSSWVKDQKQDLAEECARQPQCQRVLK